MMLENTIQGTVVEVSERDALMIAETPPAHIRKTHRRIIRAIAI
jgi:hypothetical protein